VEAMRITYAFFDAARFVGALMYYAAFTFLSQECFVHFCPLLDVFCAVTTSTMMCFYNIGL